MQVCHRDYNSYDDLEVTFNLTSTLEISALEVLHSMRYIYLRFTLLTYLLKTKVSLHLASRFSTVNKPMIQSVSLTANHILYITIIGTSHSKINEEQK